MKQEHLLQALEWEFSAFGIAFADKESGGIAIQHCSDSFFVDSDLNSEVISAWRYFTDTACRDGIVYT